MKKILVLVAIMGLIISGGLMIVNKVKAAETILNATVTGGSLSLGNTTATSVDFETKSISTVEQTTTANIGDTAFDNTVGIEVTDLRGTGVGWAATMTTTNLVTQGVVKQLSGSNATVGFTGTYNGVNAVYTSSGLYIVEITTGGVVGVASFKWTDPSGVQTTDVTTAFNVVLNNGISVNFDPATYVIGDKWSLAVDALRYNYNTTKGLTVTPSDVYAASGVTTGMTQGTQTLFTGSGTTSNAVTILNAPSDTGLGDYFIDLELSQTIHPNTYAGAYSAVATFTVS